MLFLGVHAIPWLAISPHSDAFFATIVDLVVVAAVVGMTRGVGALFAANGRALGAITTITDLERSAGVLGRVVASIASALAARAGAQEAMAPEAFTVALHAAVDDAAGAAGLELLATSPQAERAKRVILEDAERSFLRAYVARRGDVAGLRRPETYRSADAALLLEGIGQGVRDDLARRVPLREWSAVAREVGLYFLAAACSLFGVALVSATLFMWLFMAMPPIGWD